MKKPMLLALAILAFTSMNAKTDGQTYAEHDGMKIACQWIYDRVHTPKEYMEDAICNTRARTAVLDNGIIYVGRSEEKAVIIGNDTIAQSVLHRFSAKDGSPLADLPLTLNGQPYGAFLGVASVGKDNFHHIWVAPMTSPTLIKVPIYLVNIETGELTLMGELDKGDASQRTDYLDVVGDITGEKAMCTVMTAAGASAEPGYPTIYCWKKQMGETEWEGGFEGDTYIDVTEFYPETCTGFSLAPIVKIVLGESDDDLYEGNLFYIDCFARDPVLYTSDGTLIDTFDKADESVKQTDKNANGVLEFSVDGRKFLAYPKGQYDKNGNGCQAFVSEYTNEDMSMESLALRWQVPADSLGKVSDTGLRVHCLSCDKELDAEGNEVVTLFTFKSYNGMGVYKIGKNVGGDPEPPAVKGDVNGDGTVDIADVNAVINVILGSEEASKYEGRADVNKDGTVDIADVNAIINIILGK